MIHIYSSKAAQFRSTPAQFKPHGKCTGAISLHLAIVRPVPGPDGRDPRLWTRHLAVAVKLQHLRKFFPDYPIMKKGCGVASAYERMHNLSGGTGGLQVSSA